MQPKLSFLNKLFETFRSDNAGVKGKDMEKKNGSFPVTPFDFFGNLIYENVLKMNFHVINCIKTCQREQVNKLLQHFLHVKRRVNNF